MQKPAVVLRIAKGPLAGTTYVFDKPSICVLGRGDSCHPRLPNDEHHKDISRYHCMLVINPPQVFIQDLGSSNGTFLNGKALKADLFLESSIGSTQRIPSGRFTVHGGDEFALGQNAIFQVAIVDIGLTEVAEEDSATFVKPPEPPVTEDPKCLFSVARLANAL